jgi:hypothetical protein
LIPRPAIPRSPESWGFRGSEFAPVLPFIVLIRLFIVFARSFVVLIRLFIVFARSFVVLIRLFIVFARSFVVLIRLFIVFARSFVVLIRYSLKAGQIGRDKKELRSFLSRFAVVASVLPGYSSYRVHRSRLL